MKSCHSAPIVFFETEGIESLSYNEGGKYQTTADIESLKKSWSPEHMLPKMYLDREVRALHQRMRENAAN